MGFQLFMGKKQAEKTTQLQTQTISCKKEKISQD